MALRRDCNPGPSLILKMLSFNFDLLADTSFSQSVFATSTAVYSAGMLGSIPSSIVDLATPWWFIQSLKGAFSVAVLFAAGSSGLSSYLLMIPYSCFCSRSLCHFDYPLCIVHAIECAAGDRGQTNPVLKIYITIASYCSLSDCTGDVQQLPSESRWDAKPFHCLRRQFSLAMLTSTRQTKVEVLIVGSLFESKGSSPVVRCCVVE